LEVGVLNFVDPRKMSPARRERLAYWRAVPLRRLSFLLLAVFFTFATIGFLSVVPWAGKTPLAIGFGWAAFSGGIAVCYLLTIARRPQWFLPLIAFQIVANTGWSLLSKRVVAMGWFPPASQHLATTVFVWASILCIAIGYSFFLGFIQTAGRETVRATTELNLAHSIQQTLVPKLELQFERCEIFGISMPSDKVGGDLVDVVSLSDGTVVAYVADVAGHGLQAGILMGMLKTAARTHLLTAAGPATLFTTLNRVMPDVKESHMYATCAALHIGLSGPDGSRTVEYSVAGHPAILKIHGGNGEAEEFADEQLPLGLFSFAEYRSGAFDCSPGDLLMITTDGVLEVEAVGGGEFGSGRVVALLRNGAASDLPTLAGQILAAARAFGKQTDDQTLLLIRFL
jgi:hypothetical protein